jgi:hypothetical protein
MNDREKRFPSDVAVRVFLGNRQYRAFSINVSASGACLTGLEGLEPGAEISIRFLHLCIHAHVAWSSDLATGVKFREVLSQKDLHRLVGAETDGVEDESMATDVENEGETEQRSACR